MKTINARSIEHPFAERLNRNVILILTLSIMAHISCKKLVEANVPSNVIEQSNVYTNDATAIAVLTGIYTNVSSTLSSGPNNINTATGISLMCGLSADEFTLYSGVDYFNLIGYYRNQLTPNGPSATGFEYWSVLYNYVYQCNAAIDGLNASTSLTPAVKQQLLGEAKFLRGFFYFYLVNFFGDVPLALTTDYKANTLLPRTPKAQVFQQVISDLQKAEAQLNNNYLDPTLLSTTTERVRPTSWAATALLARAYLYTQSWDSADAAATRVITNSSVFSLDALDGVFLKNSTEAIWQLQPTVSFFNTGDAVTFVIPSTGFSDQNPVCLSPYLMNSFENGDQRASIGNWIDSINLTGTTYYYPYKYKISAQDPSVTSASDMSEYLMVLRLGELYLVRSEARAEQNNIGGAQGDLNIIRNRAGLQNTLANDKNSLLAAILHERQVELFSEWGHRWLDLKRTGNVDATMSIVTPQKDNGSPWQSYQQLYPLSLSDLSLSPNIVQNLGY
jgi:hypothetical protein